MKEIFIVGMGRSGTNLLAKSLMQSIDAHNFVEQRYLWLGVSPFTEKTRPYNRSRINRIKKHFYKNSNQKEWIIDKTPGNLFRFKEVLKVFPNAKFLFVVRHPYDNIISRKKMLLDKKSSSDSLKKYATHLSKLLKRKNIPLSRIPFFLFDQIFLFFIRLILKVPILGKMERVEGIFSAYKKFGAEGAFSQQLIESMKSYKKLRDHKQMLLVRYEDLNNDFENQGKIISDFLGFDYMQAQSFSKALKNNIRPETVYRWAKNTKHEEINKVIIESLDSYLKFFDYANEEFKK